MQPSIDTLPEQLVGRIIELVGLEDAESVALVCRRWHRLLFSEPALWGELTISVCEAPPEAQAWFASKRALLRRVGGLVRSLVVEDGDEVDDDGTVTWQHGVLQQLSDACGAGWQLHADVVAHLSPEVLASLTLEWGPPLGQALLAALARFSALAQLKLTSEAALPPNAPAMLAQLSRLSSLSLGGQALSRQDIAAELLAVITRLPALQDLDWEAPTLPSPGLLSALTQLTALRWYEWRRPQGSPARPHLQRLLTQLPRLNTWDVGSTTDGLWDGCMWVGDACLHLSRGVDRDPATGGVRALHLCGIRHMPALQQLIAAALPVGAQPSHLHSLSIFHSRLETDALQGCPQLAHLTGLLLSVSSFSDGPAAAVEVLLQQAPHLQNLTLLGCFRGKPVPPALVARTGLKQLSLKSNDLADLPDGPYLQGLEALVLTDNRLTRLPPALASATGLTCLCLLECDQLALSDADVDGILLRMPRLSALHLDVTRTPAPVLCRLFRAAPQLQVSSDHVLL